MKTKSLLTPMLCLCLTLIASGIRFQVFAGGTNYEFVIKSEAMNSEEQEIESLIDPNEESSVYVNYAEEYFNNIGRPYPLRDVLEFQNDYKAIVDSANVILDIVKNDYNALNLRSFAEFHLGNYEQSLDDALRVLEEPLPENISWDIIYAIIELKPKMVKSRLMQELDSENNQLSDELRFNYLNFLYSCERADNNNPGAFKIAKQLYEYPETEMTGALMLSTIYLQNGTAQKALEVLQPYVGDLEDLDWSILNNYVLALRDAGRSKDAFKLMDKALAAEDGYFEKQNLLLNYAIMQNVTGKHKEALENFDQLIREREDLLFSDSEYDPMLERLYLYHGIVNSILGNEEAAKKDLNKGLAISALARDITGLEATLSAWLGDKENTLKWLDKYQATDGASVAACYANLGDTAKAIELLEKEFDAHTSNPTQILYDTNFVRLRKTPEYKALAKKYVPYKYE